MPRYLLFGGEHCYPNGGAQDLLASHDDLGTLLALQGRIRSKGIGKGAGKCLLANSGRSLDWWHVLDLETGTLMDSSEEDALDHAREINSAVGVQRADDNLLDLAESVAAAWAGTEAAEPAEPEPAKKVPEEPPSPFAQRWTDTLEETP